MKIDTHLPEAEARTTYDLLDPGSLGYLEVFAVREYDLNGKAVRDVRVGFFDNPDDFLTAIRPLSGSYQVYCGMNPRPDRLCRRAPNEMRSLRGGQYTVDNDIEYVTGVLLDFDCAGKQRPTTKKELQHTVKAAKRAQRYLVDKGFEPGVLSMSGNGAQVWLAFQPWRIKPGELGLVKAKISALQQEILDVCGNQHVNIDSIANPSHKAKCISTMSIKGTEEPGRPYRRTRFLSDNVERVEDAKLLEYIKSLQVAKKYSSGNKSKPVARRKLEISDEVPDEVLQVFKKSRKARELFRRRKDIYDGPGSTKTYQSESEADLALGSVLKGFGIADESIIATALALRHANVGKETTDDYLQRTIDKIFDGEANKMDKTERRREAKNVEKKLIWTLLLNAEHRNRLLAETHAADFTDNICKEVRERIDDLREEGVTDWHIAFRHDAALSSSAREMVWPSKEIRSKARKASLKWINALLRKHKDFLRRQHLEDISKDLTRTCDKNSLKDADFVKAAADLHNAALKLQRREDRKEARLGTGMTRMEYDELYKELITRDESAYIPSGFPEIDQHIGAFRKGQMVIISAPTGQGKSAFAMIMAIKQSRLGRRVLFMSLEMRLRDLVARVAAHVSSVRLSKIHNAKLDGGDKGELNRCLVHYIKKCRKSGGELILEEITKANFSVLSVETEVLRYQPDVVVVDYLSRLSNISDDQTWLGQKKNSNFLQSMAKRRNCLVVAVLQQNSSQEVKYGTAPAEDADYWFQWQMDKTGNERDEINLTKARHAAPANFPVDFDFAHMRINLEKAQPYRKDIPDRSKPIGSYKGTGARETKPWEQKDYWQAGDR
ncbi:DnaB-like helicase C-terminal domain-containing protein [Myxococcota bacterium]